MTPEQSERLRGELVLASLGLESILRATPKWTAERQENADKLLPRARALILRFLGGATDPVSDLPAFDYDDVNELLLGVDEEQLAAFYKAVPEDIQDDVEGVATRIVTQLQAQQPRSVRKSAVKATTSPPAPMELGKFRRRWSVANDPAIVLNDLIEGNIDSDMVQAFAEFYPTLFQAIAGEGGIVDDAIATMKSRRGEKWDIDESRDRLIRVLLQADSFNPDLARDLAAAAPDPQNQPQRPHSRPVSLSKMQDKEQLPGQKA